jgi:hypothetical protein
MKNLLTLLLLTACGAYSMDTEPDLLFRQTYPKALVQKLKNRNPNIDSNKVALAINKHLMVQDLHSNFLRTLNNLTDISYNECDKACDEALSEVLDNRF